MSKKFQNWLVKISAYSNNIPAGFQAVHFQPNKKDHAFLIEQYAGLVGRMLWTSFARLSRADFNDVSAFTKPEKASASLQHYLNIYNTLTLFIRNNIGEQGDELTRAAAFQHWLDVAAELDKNECNEGLYLVFTALMLCSNTQLRNQLTPAYEKKFQEYSELLSPRRNYGNLRTKLKDQEGGFYPVFLWFKDLIVLDTVHDLQGTDAQEDSNGQKDKLLDSIESLIKQNPPPHDVVGSLHGIASLATQKDIGSDVAENLLELIRLDLISHFLQAEHKTTGWFGGEWRVMNGQSCKMPRGIAQIYDRVNNHAQNHDAPLDVLREIRQILTERQQAWHTFFNSRQTITHQFYQQCSSNIDHLLRQT